MKNIREERRRLDEALLPVPRRSRRVYLPNRGGHTTIRGADEADLVILQGDLLKIDKLMGRRSPRGPHEYR